MKRVNSFVAMNSEAQEISRKKDESSSKKAEITQDNSAKRAGDKLESDKSKEQKTDENKEAEDDDEAEMKMHMEIVKEGLKGFYHLIRVDGSSNRYSSMIMMLHNISREDLETL
ncbi:hypothetical protein Tco_0370437 [Tanacetum coccineum]